MQRAAPSVRSPVAESEATPASTVPIPDPQRITQAQAELDALVRDYLAPFEGYSGVAWTHKTGSRAGAPFFGQMRKSWNRDLSGDVQYALQPYWMMTSSSSMTTHGSPHSYDTNVPILFYGPRWVKRGMVNERVEVSGIAPTLAQMLRVPPPSASEGQVLPVVASPP